VYLQTMLHRVDRAGSHRHGSKEPQDAHIGYLRHLPKAVKVCVCRPQRTNETVDECRRDCIAMSTNEPLPVLAPCPFCNGTPYVDKYSKGSNLVYVHCKCGATCGQGVMYSGFSAAIAAWNRRTPPAERSCDGLTCDGCRYVRNASLPPCRHCSRNEANRIDNYEAAPASGATGGA